MRINIDDDDNFRLKPNPNISHESAEDWYANYGAHISTSEGRDICVQAVEYEWLDDPDDAIEKVMDGSRITRDEAEELVSLAIRVREAAEAVEVQLAAASMAALDGNLSLTLEHLREARNIETDHGDDPATSELAAQLLERAEEGAIDG